MIRTTKYGPVTRFDLSRKIAGRGRYWTTAYLVDNMMVDTGCAHTRVEIADKLKTKNLTYIVNTHSHEDHIGANHLLRTAHGEITIYAHPRALPVLANPHAEQPLHLYRRLVWGWPDKSSAQPVDHLSILETEKYQFQVIYTPGHSTDHICLYEAKHGWLFSGDLFVGGKDRALRAGCDIWEVIESLKSVAKYPLQVLFPGSARVRKDPEQELINKIDYLERIGQEVLERARKDYSTAAIARELFGGPMFIELFTFGHFSRRQLVLSYLSRIAE